MDTARSIAFDGTSGVFVAGLFTGSADFTGDGKVDVKSAGNVDCFVVKLNAAREKRSGIKRSEGLVRRFDARQQF